jgi:hypothetical protein
MNRNWIAPLCGVAFVVIVVVGFSMAGGEGQDPAKHSAQDVASYYADHDSTNMIGAALLALAGVPLLFFAGWIREVLGAGRPDGTLPNVAFGSLIALAAAMAVGATIHFALADFADESQNVGASAISAVNVIDFDFFLPFAMAMTAFLLSTGLAVLRGGALPRWIGWVAIVIGIVSLAGPVGFFGFLAGLVLIAVIGIVGAIRGRSAAPAAA